MNLGPTSAAMKAHLDAVPGAEAAPMNASRGTQPLVLIYKVMGKMFAILSVRGYAYVILKCDPHLAETLRDQYAGVGHRSHLDRRYWISIDLEADVPLDEAKRLALHSFDQVRASLTRKQQAALAAALG